MKRLLLNFLNFLILLISLSTCPLSAEQCGDTVPRPNRIDVGLAIENLIPSRLPNFAGALPAYGVMASFPWGKDAIELEMLYGTSPLTEVRLFEVAYRLNVATSHLNGFALVGAHLLSYATPGPDETFFGGFLGMGSTLSMAERFAIDAFLKTYFQTRPMLAVGGAFRLAL